MRKVTKVLIVTNLCSFHPFLPILFFIYWHAFLTCHFPCFFLNSLSNIFLICRVFLLSLFAQTNFPDFSLFLSTILALPLLSCVPSFAHFFLHLLLLHIFFFFFCQWNSFIVFYWVCTFNFRASISSPFVLFIKHSSVPQIWHAFRLSPSSQLIHFPHISLLCLFL